MNSRLPLLAASVLIAAGLLTACAAEQPAAIEPEPVPTTAPVDDASPQPVAEPTPVETETPATVPTCENIVSEGTVAGLTDLGWTSEPSAFTIGDVTLEGGILCNWNDPEDLTEQGQFFAWAPVERATAQDLQHRLHDEGWIREEGDRGIYFTELPDAAFQTDAEGYGITYLFGDGWVTYADTKQSLILISAP